MRFELLHPADQIVMIMQRIYAYGMTTTSGGSLSIRDENGDIWITPAGVDKGSLARRDIICVAPDGTASGAHRPSSARRDGRCASSSTAHTTSSSSTQGTFSQRLAGSDFVITPFGLDRKYIEPSDLVRVENGRAEAGKTPSRSLNLHRRIYELQPAVDAVIIAHPPSAMVFAVTDSVFDSRTIPESYILLRDVPRRPFGTNLIDVERAASTLSVRNPVVILENDSLMFAGTTLLNAFDRLEVAEYSAKAIIAARELGDIVAIGAPEVEQLVAAFNLDK